MNNMENLTPAQILALALLGLETLRAGEPEDFRSVGCRDLANSMDTFLANNKELVETLREQV